MTATIKGATQTALSFQAFRVVGCEFKVTGELTEKTMKNSKLEFQYRVGTLDKEEEEQRHFGVEFFLKVQGKFLSIDIDAMAAFETQKPIDEKFLSSPFARQNAPAIAFPFLRSFLQTLCVNAGIPPIILPAINFVKLSAENK